MIKRPLGLEEGRDWQWSRDGTSLVCIDFSWDDAATHVEVAQVRTGDSELSHDVGMREEMLQGNHDIIVPMGNSLLFCRQTVINSLSLIFSQ